ncbi:kinase-like protein [Clavulina sp. PMI_390]|nr:kinase-like protein [Clavulina sp. PMI_390]
MLLNQWLPWMGLAPSDPETSDDEEFEIIGVPKLPPPMLEKLGMKSQLDVLELPHNKQTDFLNRIYDVLRDLSLSSVVRTLALRCLQDFCYHFSSLPTPFRLYDVKFTRVSPMGRGGEATTYRGQMPGEQMNLPGKKVEVVVREMFLTADEWNSPVGKEVAKLVHREAITHSQLDHSNILRFLGIYHETDVSPPLTIVSYIPGGSLEALLIPEKLLGAPRFQKILRGINEGVKYLHSLETPVIHGDLHPGNVLLDKNDCPRLCDFGQSRIRHEVTRTRTKRQAGGRARFLAPELTESPADQFRTTWQSDIHSFGMLLLNMWTGERPFSDVEHEWQVSAKLVDGKRPKRPCGTSIQINLDKSVEGDFWNLLVKMWAQDPMKRPPSGMLYERFREMFPDKV